MSTVELRDNVLKWTWKWGTTLLAEAVSTGLLVWLGCATCVQFDVEEEEGRPTVENPKAEPALSFGLMVMANMIMFGPTSGAHMNPAVTLGAALSGKLTPRLALGYVAAQLLGATLGYAALLATTPADKAQGLCLTQPAVRVASLSAVAIELAITFVLVMVVCCLWAAEEPERPDRTVPIKVGLVVAGLIYAAGGATGASLNPARSFGPAVLTSTWNNHWVYWAGPMLGGALAPLLLRFVLSGAPAPVSDAPSKPREAKKASLTRRPSESKKTVVSAAVNP